MKLFNEKSELVKEATLALPVDEAKWNKEIITDFLSTFPMLQQTPINLVWRKKSASKGYGIGTLAVLGGAVPIVVKDFKAYPFDLIVFPDKVIPLDMISIRELMSSDSPFLGAMASGNKGSLSLFGDMEQQWSPINSSSQGNDGSGTVTRPSVKLASFVENISSFDYKDLEKIAAELQEDDFLKDVYENSEVMNTVLLKIADKATNYDKQWVDLLKQAEMDRQYIFKDTEGNSFVKQAFSEIDHVCVTPITWDEEQVLSNTFAPIEKVASAEAEEHFSACDEIKPGSAGRFVDKAGNTTGRLQILGIEKKAEIRDFTVLPNGKGEALVINSNGDFSIINKKVAKAINADKLKEMVDNKPEVGNRGVFVVNGVATEDFKITKIVPDMSLPGKFEIHAERFAQPKIVFKLIPTSMDSVTQDPNSINTYYVPGNAIFVKLKRQMESYHTGRIQEFIDNRSEFLEYNLTALKDLEPVSFTIKTAEAITEDVIPLDAFFGESHTPRVEIPEYKVAHIVSRDRSGAFHMFGPEFEKYAELGHIIHNVSEEDIAWPLIHMGVAEETFDEIMNMGNGDEIKIANHIKSPISIEHYVPLAKLATTKGSKVWVESLPHFVKFAAKYEGDATTVDAVLSLGMVNKFNIEEYLTLIPEYERVLGELARLLMYVRVSSDAVDEQILTALVSYMNKIIYDLKTARAVVNTTTGVDRDTL